MVISDGGAFDGDASGIKGLVAVAVREGRGAGADDDWRVDFGQYDRQYRQLQNNCVDTMNR